MWKVVAKIEVRRQKAEIRRQRSEGRRQKAEDRRQKTEGRRQKADQRQNVCPLISVFCFLFSVLWLQARQPQHLIRLQVEGLIGEVDGVVGDQVSESIAQAIEADLVGGDGLNALGEVGKDDNPLLFMGADKGENLIRADVDGQR